MERIEVNPRILGGKPVIKGTRIPVYLIIELLAAGMSSKDIIEEYPELTEEDVKAAVEYAARMLKGEFVEVPA
ncbi:MAG: DUF433 domain-containing protein [Candidatus Diapherotrites archaeon]|nr:DUF433 domain-containing protein [Candidatus Diapherotrites archaeon]